MNALTQRLKDGVAALENLDRIRATTGNAEFGIVEEDAIVLTELRDLENEILSNSGLF